MFYQTLLSLLGMGPENEEWPQQVVGYRAGDGTGGIEYGEEMG